MLSDAVLSLRKLSEFARRKSKAVLLRRACDRVVGELIEALENRELLSVSPTAVGLPHPNSHAHHVPAKHVVQAEVVTNKLDYQPGQKAIITGSGFRPHEQVLLQVLHTDGTPNTAPEHQPWIVRAGDHGGFKTSYPVGQDDLNTTLQLTAVGLKSGRTAQETFTDSRISSTTVTLKSSINPSSYDQSVTFTATVSGGSTPTGTVTFYDGSSFLGSGSLSSGKATFTTSSLSVAVHPITATYGGDSSHRNSGSSVLNQTVNQSTTATTTTLVSSSGAGQASIVAPSHIVIVIEEDRAAGAIGDTTNMPYFNQLASTGLVFNNSHGLNTTSQQGEMNYLALYSGSTQGVTDDGSGYSFSGPDLAQSLSARPGLSFAGYAENLPSDGAQNQLVSGTSHGITAPDLYSRDYNPMAMFDAANNAAYNKTFSEFPTNYANLPTVSFVIPNNFDNTHGSNDTYPWAGSTDTTNNNTLRQWADTWLQQKMDGYLQWAKQNNSLLIVTDDEGDRNNNFAAGFATIINGDSSLFVPGTNTTNENPYNLLRTIENMYGLTPLGNSATASALTTNAQGRLAPAASSSNQSVFGQPVNFTATVAPVPPGTGTPTGSVQFQIDGSNFGSPVALSGGVATSPSISSLSLGNHTVTAVYSGAGGFAASTAAGLTQTVAQAGTSATLTSSANPSSAGQGVTFTATIAASAPGSGTPTGTVTFKDGTSILGTGTLNASRQASFTTSSLSAATHSITAVYAGDANFAGSTSASISQVVNPTATAASTTTVTSSLGSSVVGQSVHFTATVAAMGGSGTPTGSVQFLIDGSNFGSPVALINGSAASPSISSLAVGGHAVSAVYGGDSNFGGSTAPAITQTVGQASTSTSVQSPAGPFVWGQGVTFTATVTVVAPGAGTPTGTVTFKDGSTVLGTGALNSSGLATFTTSSLSVASHSITAAYSGDVSFAGSNAVAVAQSVNQASSTTTLVSSANSAAFGQSVTFTATVAAVAPGSGAPTGTVTFMDGSAVLGTGTLNGSGQATFTTSALAIATHSITAVYSGDAHFVASTSAILSQVINPVQTGVVNDNFANSITIPGTFTTMTGTNVGATKEAGEPNHAGNTGGASVWWNWTAPVSGTVTIDTLGSNFDTTMAVYTGTSVSTLTAVPNGSNDDSIMGGTSTSRVQFAVTAGTVYQIAVDGYNGASGNITLHLQMPVNDNFSNATVITGTSASITGTSLGATKEAGEPNHAGNSGGRSVWYTWTAPSSGTVTIDTHGSSFDTLLAVYTGNSVSTLTAVPGGSNDDDPAGGTYTSKVTFNVTAGTVYRIAVDGWGGQAGTVVLNLSLS